MLTSYNHTAPRTPFGTAANPARICSKCKDRKHTKCSGFRRVGHGQQLVCYCRICAAARKGFIEMDTPDMKTQVRAIGDVLSRYRFRFKNEDELQQGMAQAFSAARIEARREVRLDSENRLDFLVGRLAIEVKVAGQFTRAALVRQLERYALSDEVESILVVTNKIIEAIPAQMNGKTVQTIILIRSML